MTNIKNKKKAANELLYEASKSGNLAELGRAIEQGANLEDRDESFGQTALMRTSSRGYPQSAKMLLDAGVNVNTKADDGDTALIIAAYSGEFKVAKLLIENGADLEAQGKNGMTPLARALLYGEPLTVTLLLEAGANLDAKINDEKRVREYARTDEMRELVKAADIKKQLYRGNFTLRVEEIVNDLNQDLR